MKKYLFILFCLLVLGLNEANAKVVEYNQQDSILFEDYCKKFRGTDLPLNQLIVETALYLQGAPYVAGTLDRNKKEKLIINLREFDCTTFVESCITMSKAVQFADCDPELFRHYLRSIRYRNGEIIDYTSRLHYMTDWVYDNMKKGFVSDISQKLGGKAENKVINFMSEHFAAYKPLTNDHTLQNKIKVIEREIASRNSYVYVPKENIKSVQHLIKDGDIIIFATSIKGLDYSHVGIAYHKEGKLSFIHASTRPMQVVIEPQSLATYCSKLSKCTGITVVRVNEE